MARYKSARFCAKLRSLLCDALYLFPLVLHRGAGVEYRQRYCSQTILTETDSRSCAKSCWAWVKVTCLPFMRLC